MTPYFSIRISINPLDSHEEDGQRDEQSIKLSIARQTDRTDGDEKDAMLSDEHNVCEKLVEAILWLANKAPRSESDQFLSYFVGQLITEQGSALEEILEAEVDCGDADFGDMIRRIAKKCEEANI